MLDLRGEHLHPVHRPVPVLGVGRGEHRGRLVVPAVEEPLRRVDLVHVLGRGQEPEPLRAPGSPGRQVGVHVRGAHRVQAADVVGDVLAVHVEPVERVVDMAGGGHPRLRAVGERGLTEAQEADHRVHVMVVGGALVHHRHRLAAKGRGPALDDAVHGQVDLVVERLPADGPVRELLVDHRDALALELIERARRRHRAAVRVADQLQPLVGQVAAGGRGRPGVVDAAAELDETGPGEGGALGVVAGRVQVLLHEDLRGEVGHLRAEHRQRVPVCGVAGAHDQGVAHLGGEPQQRLDDRQPGLAGRGGRAAGRGVHRPALQRGAGVVGDGDRRGVDARGDLVGEGLVHHGRRGGRVVLLLEVGERGRARRLAELALQVAQQGGVARSRRRHRRRRCRRSARRRRRRRPGSTASAGRTACTRPAAAPGR